MRRSLEIWQLVGAVFTAVLGTLLHFLYAWTGIPSLTPVCAVNESTWEHIKILFFPMLFFALLQSRFFRKEYAQFWQIKCVGCLVGICLIPVLFYTYNGVFGKSSGVVNVLIFFLADGGAYATEYLCFRRNALQRTSPTIAKCLLALLCAAFVLFTYFPPNLPLFLSPV